MPTNIMSTLSRDTNPCLWRLTHGRHLGVNKRQEKKNKIGKGTITQRVNSCARKQLKGEHRLIDWIMESSRCATFSFSTSMTSWSSWFHHADASTSPFSSHCPFHHPPLARHVTPSSCPSEPPQRTRNDSWARLPGNCASCSSSPQSTPVTTEKLKPKQLNIQVWILWMKHQISPTRNHWISENFCHILLPFKGEITHTTGKNWQDICSQICREKQVETNGVLLLFQAGSHTTSKTHKSGSLSISVLHMKWKMVTWCMIYPKTVPSCHDKT